MVRRRPRAGGKIWELIDLHDQHPDALEASLILAGLRWRDVESSSPRRRAHAWQDVAAVIATLPWDAPLRRALPDWQWGDPKHDLLITILESVAALSAKTPNQTKAKKADLLRVPRPWDQAKTAKRIGTPMPIADLAAWLDGDFAPVSEETHRAGQKSELPVTT